MVMTNPAVTSCGAAPMGRITVPNAKTAARIREGLIFRNEWDKRWMIVGPERFGEYKE